ncbi:DUF932 domain-containing protein [Hyphomicrobium sp.]|uniref:DUF932 domain-containing protein n=1 Tax=Hyphomicrobium sp. TaxID=82 RepID=UPI001D8ABA26|nr:DUF932 domain-containing protein [Hyphomicrobium sp.]MBY0561509.1 DUF932 domain-containing protein [Hyphomicrobium sp.]
MGHNIEVRDGKHQFAYVGEDTWHGLGKRVPAGLSPDQFLKECGLDWRVEKRPGYTTNRKGEMIPTGKSALVRDIDDAVLDDGLTGGWQPFQNEDWFDIFHEFVERGELEMHSGGSLKGGRSVFGLAKSKEGFELFNGRDVYESYWLFHNPHMKGYSGNARHTSTRVVCDNTLQEALSGSSVAAIAIWHNQKFDPEIIAEMIRREHQRNVELKAKAEFLISKRYAKEDIVDYFKAVFDLEDAKPNKDGSERVVPTMQKLLKAVDEQPGAELGEGSYYQLFNAATYAVDHVIGKTSESRLANSWFGNGTNTKNKALSFALDMAG